MSSNKTSQVASNAVGGKTARACDSCIRKRARWYCAADDAFLCQACDSLVHSANPLSRRHERVSLKSASFKRPLDELTRSDDNQISSASGVPSWHKEFTRKARTPRNGSKSTSRNNSGSNKYSNNNNPFHIVPEVGSDETTSHEEFSNDQEEEQQQLLYRVPIFDPLVAELCTSSTTTTTTTTTSNNEPINASMVCNDSNHELHKVNNCNSYEHIVDNLHQGILPSDMDLVEFAADVESLFRRGLEDECFGMEDLGLMDSKEIDASGKECSFGSHERVKLEEEDGKEVEEGGAMACQIDSEIDLMREAFQLNFKDYDTPAGSCGEEDNKAEIGVGALPAMKISVYRNDDHDHDEHMDDSRMKKKMKRLLSLDCEGVISAWGSQGSPWTNGERPKFEIDECWPDCTGTYGIEVQPSYGVLGGLGGHLAVMGGGGREARVSRYREKRRTRLFSKKIRYEVRKLNAEKRPRMKGRFVKRAVPFPGHPFPMPNK